MSCCLDTNHFVGTPLFFRIILWIITLWGDCSRQASLSQFFLCYLATILFFSSNCQLAFELEDTNKCAARKCRSWVCLQTTQLQCPMGCHGHHAILCNPTRFSETISAWHLLVPLKHFASISYCPWVQGKSIKRPHPLPRSVFVCVFGGGGGGIVIPGF